MSTRWRALQHGNFRLFFAGQLASLIGTWMQSAAQLWLVYRLTGSAALLGVFGFANQIPIFLLAPVGGIVADSYSKHKGVIWTQTAAMVLAFLLAALTLTGVVKVWHLIAIAFLVGVVNAFDIPLRQAFLHDMVEKEDQMNAIALNSSIFNGARVVGPAIAGFAIAAVGEGWCFFLNGVSFLAVIGALLAMRITVAAPKKHEGSVWRNFLEGIQFVMRDQPIRSALLMLSLLSLVVLPYSVLLPIFANNILHSGARGLGLLMSAAGVGAVLGALHFAARTDYSRLVGWIAVTSAGCGASLALFSQSRVFGISLVIIFVVGFSATVQLAAVNTLIQRRVPDGLRGRVMAVYASMFMGIQPVGALIAGGIARRIGVPFTVGAGGLICLMGALLFTFLVWLPVERQKKEAAAHAGLGR